MLCWIPLLAAYDYTLKYRPGPRNSNADALSRLPVPGREDETQPPGDVLLLDAVEHPPSQASDITELTKRDHILSTVKNHILSGWPTDYENDFAAFATRKTELSLHRDCILWGNRVVIPQEARDYVLRLLHTNHPGMTAVKSQARSLIWWPKYSQHIHGVNDDEWAKLRSESPVNR